MKSIDEYCAVLGIDPHATPEQFKQTYRDLAKVWHPDRFSHDPRLQTKAEEKLKEINEAYRELQSFFSNAAGSGSRSTDLHDTETEAGQQTSEEPPPKSPPEPQPAPRDREPSRGVKKWKGGFARNALLALVVFIAFAVVQAFVKSVMRAPREGEAVNEVEKYWEQLQADATYKHPDKPLSEAVLQESIDRSTEKLNLEPDELKRANMAADIFWGFFFINARERAEFCRELGVDIDPFVKAFERVHINEIAKARSIYARVPFDEEKLYIVLKPQMRKALIQDMHNIAASSKMSLKEGCQMISENVDALVQEMHISKIHPIVFKALTSAK